MLKSWQDTSLVSCFVFIMSFVHKEGGLTSRIFNTVH